MTATCNDCIHRNYCANRTDFEMLDYICSEWQAEAPPSKDFDKWGDSK